MELLSPCDSQITTPTRCSYNWVRRRRWTRTSLGVWWRAWSYVCDVSRRSVVVPTRGGQDLWLWYLFSFDFVHSRTLCYLDECMNVELIVWHGECKPIISFAFHPYFYMRCAKIPYLRSFQNGLIPLSRASTRRSYSRILGITSWYSEPSPT